MWWSAFDFSSGFPEVTLSGVFHYLPLAATVVGAFLIIAAAEFLQRRAWARVALEVTCWLYLAFVVVIFPLIWLLIWWFVKKDVSGPGPMNLLRTFAIVWGVNVVVQGALWGGLVAVLRGRTVREAVDSPRSAPRRFAFLLGLALAVFVLSGVGTKLLRSEGRSSGSVPRADEGVTSNGESDPESRVKSLRQAIRDARVQTVSRLLEEGVSLQTEQFYTPLLQHAAKGGNTDIIRMLLKHGASVDEEGPDGRTALHKAAKQGNVAASRVLLENGAGPNVKSDVDEITPLHQACFSGSPRSGSPETVALLLRNGANPATRSSSGSTPLHLASWCGCVECARLLLAEDADPDAKSENGRTPLHHAAKNGRERLVALLAEAGAKLDVQDNYGDTPLHSALVYRQDATALFLIDHGASVDVTNQDGQTPLHLAAAGGSEKVVKGLINANASVGIADEGGHTALELAKRNGHKKIVNFLRKRAKQ